MTTLPCHRALCHSFLFSPEAWQPSAPPQPNCESNYNQFRLAKCIPDSATISHSAFWKFQLELLSMASAAAVSSAVATAASAASLCRSFGFRNGSLRASSRVSVVGFRWTKKVASTHTRRRFSPRAMATSTKSPSSLYDFVVKDIRGNDVELSRYRGKVLLIVNVASQCGLTNTNYTELADLYTKYKTRDFEVLAFPCNQFGGQEPGTNEQIQEFACTRFKAEYPIFDKVDVNGSQVAPLYKYLKAQKGGWLGDNIKWNFAKFLVDKNGNVVDRYAPTTPPSKIEKDIEKYLST